MPRIAITRFAVEVGPDGGELLLASRSRAMRSSRRVHAPLRASRALRSLRVVQSLRVSSISSSSRWPGVAHEAAHRGVGPAAVALAVAVEAQVQLDEAA